MMRAQKTSVSAFTAAHAQIHIPGDMTAFVSGGKRARKDEAAYPPPRPPGVVMWVYG